MIHRSPLLWLAPCPPHLRPSELQPWSPSLPLLSGAQASSSSCSSLAPATPRPSPPALEKSCHCFPSLAPTTKQFLAKFPPDSRSGSFFLPHPGPCGWPRPSPPSSQGSLPDPPLGRLCPSHSVCECVCLHGVGGRERSKRRKEAGLRWYH